MYLIFSIVLRQSRCALLTGVQTCALPICAWALGHVGVGLMAWLSLIAIVILQKPALAALRDYQRQRKSKVADYDFDPVALGIRNANYWEQRKAGLEPDLPEPGKSDR